MVKIDCCFLYHAYNLLAPLVLPQVQPLETLQLVAGLHHLLLQLAQLLLLLLQHLLLLLNVSLQPLVPLL